MPASTSPPRRRHIFTHYAAARFLVTAFTSASGKVDTEVYLIREFAAPPIILHH